MKRRGLSLFLVLSMLLGSVPVSAIEAAEYPTVTAEVEKPDTGISTAALFGTVSGYCGGEGDGTNLSWTLTQDGTLTISGTGAMSTFSYNSTAAWRAYGNDVKTVNIENGVTSIGRYAFYACDNLTSVTIGNDVKTIGESAFEECADLVSVSMGNSVVGIGKSAFKYCGNLTNVTLPDSVTSIGQSAFYDCDSLTSMVIPNGVTSINASTFDSCDRLTSVTIPSRVTNIGSYAFAYCIGLTSINIPNSVKTISEYAFSYCRNLEYIEIPNSVTSIGLSAFASCEKLMHVTISDYVTSLGDYAFSRCSNLTSVEIGSGVTSIGRYTFAQCSSLKDLKVSENNSAFCAEDSVLYSKDMTQLLMLPASKEGHFTIPNGVTSIGRFAVYECDFLTSVTIPASVTMIDWNAFYLCDNLKSVFFAGNAPSVYPTSYTAPSFAPDVTLHYIPDTSGWTDSGFYDAAAGTWNGYELTMWEHGKRFIAPLFGTTIEINGKGYGYGYYMVTDDVGSPLSGIPVVVQIDGTTLKRVTDGNGVIRVKTPEDSMNCTYDITFEMPGFIEELQGAQQTLEVVVNPLSYEKTWEGSLGKELKAGLSEGIGVGVGVASFDATAAKASVKAGVNGQFALTDEYDNGNRNLELQYTHDLSAGVEFKSGVTATVPCIDIDIVSAETGATLVMQSQTGLKIKDYDPDDLQQTRQVGMFLLQTALTGWQSVWGQKLLDALEVSAHNQSASATKVVLDAGASLGAIKIKGDGVGFDKKVDAKIAGIGTTRVYSIGKAKDFLEDKESQFVAFESDADVGLLKLPTTSYTPGFEANNSVKILAEYDASDETMNEFRVELYEEGKKNILWNSAVEENTTEFVMDADQAAAFAADEPALKAYLNRTTPVLSLNDISSVLQRLDKVSDGAIERTDISKQGVDIDLPFFLNAGASVEVEFKGSFVNELKIPRGTEYIVNGEVYPASVSTYSMDHAKENSKSFGEILSEPIEAVKEGISDFFKEAINNVETVVDNAIAKVKETGKECWVEIKTFFGADTKSYAILTLRESDEPDTNAAVSVTIGDPYAVTVYADENKTEMLSDEELAEAPVSLTLRYDAALLHAAGAAADSDIRIYRFDAERNLYICVGGVQDKDAMTVTADITAHGEYILATDNASPLISDFALSNNTATPTLTALVSDLSGISAFSFRMDEGDVLVDENNLDKYYDETSGVFTYKFTDPLTAGAHTAYFEAADGIGNANTEPFTFTFVIDAAAPVIETVTVPTETVDAAFDVAAMVSDDKAVGHVWMEISADDTDPYSVPLMLDEQRGNYCGTVTEVAGVERFEIVVCASDAAGNLSESETMTVLCDAPAGVSGVQIKTNAEEGKVSIRMKNIDAKAVSGWLVCASYDANGKMIDVTEEYVGLKRAESKTVVLNFDCSNAASVRAFLLDPEEYVPR